MDYHFEFLTIDPVTCIGVLCNTLILFLVFRHFLFGRVKKVMEQRNAEISKTYDDADSALKSAKDKEAEYTARLASAKEESAEIVRNATIRAQQHSDEIIGEAREEAQSIVTRANADIEKERKCAVNSIKNDISDIAVSIAEKIVSRNIESDEEQDRLIDEFISGLGDEGADTK